MECIEEGATHEVLGPEHARRFDQKCAAETREAKAGEGGGESEEALEPCAETDAVILIDDNDGIHDKGWGGADVDHHVNEDMFFDVEGPWVQADFATAENGGEVPGADGEDESECLAERVCNEEDEGRRDIRCGITKGEKSVEGDADAHESETEEPHAEGHGGHFWVVYITDAGPYFGVWRVLFLLCCVHVRELVGHGDILGAKLEGGGVGIKGDAFELGWGHHRCVIRVGGGGRTI